VCFTSIPPPSGTSLSTQQVLGHCSRQFGRPALWPARFPASHSRNFTLLSSRFIARFCALLRPHEALLIYAHAEVGCNNRQMWRHLSQEFSINSALLTAEPQRCTYSNLFIQELPAVPQCLRTLRFSVDRPTLFSRVGGSTRFTVLRRIHGAHSPARSHWILDPPL
jgi:hypothetical protein